MMELKDAIQIIKESGKNQISKCIGAGCYAEVGFDGEVTYDDLINSDLFDSYKNNVPFRFKGLEFVVDLGYYRHATLLRRKKVLKFRIEMNLKNYGKKEYNAEITQEDAVEAIKAFTRSSELDRLLGIIENKLGIRITGVQFATDGGELKYYTISHVY